MNHKMSIKKLLEKIEVWFMNLGWIKAILIVFFIPFLFSIPLIIIIIASYINHKSLNIIFNIPKQDYVYYYIYFMTMIVNGILSYMIYKITKLNNDISTQSLKLQKKLADNELNREKSIIKENALIIYHDLHFGLTKFIKLYAQYCNKEEVENEPKQICISKDWIDKVAVLSKVDDLEGHIMDIYMLYEGLSNVSRFLYNYSYAITNNHTFHGPLVRALNEFNTQVFNSSISDEIGDVKTYESWIDNKYLNVIKKLKDIESTY